MTTPAREPATTADNARGRDLPCVSASTAHDPQWVVDKIDKAACEAAEHSAGFSSSDVSEYELGLMRDSLELAILKRQVMQLRNELAIYTRKADALMERVSTRPHLPRVMWIRVGHDTSAALIGVSDSDADAVQWAQELDLPEDRPRIDGRRRWRSDIDGFAVSILGVPACGKGKR